MTCFGVGTTLGWESSRHGYSLLAGIEMVFWGLTEALQTAFYMFCRACTDNQRFCRFLALMKSLMQSLGDRS